MNSPWLLLQRKYSREELSQVDSGVDMHEPIVKLNKLHCFSCPLFVRATISRAKFFQGPTFLEVGYKGWADIEVMISVRSYNNRRMTTQSNPYFVSLFYRTRICQAKMLLLC